MHGAARRSRVIDLKADGVEATAAKIREGGGRSLAMTADVTRMETHRDAMSAILDKFGALHYAVNNAGISGVFGALPDIPPRIGTESSMSI